MSDRSMRTSTRETWSEAGVPRLVQESVSMIYRDHAAEWIDEDWPTGPTLRRPVPAGLRMAAGRASCPGLDTAPGAPTLAAVKRMRIAELLVGPFEFTHVTRSFDGELRTLPRPPSNAACRIRTPIVPTARRVVFLQPARRGLEGGERAQRDGDGRRVR